MTKRDMLTQLRADFTAKLAAKTGWGKNEILAAFDEVVRELLLKMLDEE